MASDTEVTFDTLTTGNFGGFDAWIEEEASTILSVNTDHVAGELALADIGLDGLGRFHIPKGNL